MNFRALALGAAIGFLAAVVPSCGKAGNCGPSNCSGCCDSTGTCVKPTGNGNNTTCGTSGNTCVDCTKSSMVCNSSFKCASGGAGGGSGGAGGSGGSGACNATNCANGCCSGTLCIPAGSTGQNANNCGTGGATCAMCPAMNVCAAGMCRSSTAIVKIGDACVMDADCAGLGGNFKCKTMTSTGSGTYAGGYCTRPCTANTDCMVTGATAGVCVGGLDAYGEAEDVCWASCTQRNMAPGDCRQGYACYGLTSGGMAAGAGCWLYPAPTPDAGPPSDKIGNPCTTNANCQNPPDPQYAVCVLEFFRQADGGMTTNPTGYSGGYCSANCGTDDAICGDAGICFSDFPQTGFFGCVQRCTAPFAGPGSCRNGYVCDGYFLRGSDGGIQPSADGFCSPSCFVAGAECRTDAGEYCDAGYCAR